MATNSGTGHTIHFGSVLGRVLVLPAVFALGSCATPAHYRTPTQEPLASLTLETTAPHRNIRLVAYSGLQNAESEGSLIGVLNPADKTADIGKTITIQIAAGRPFRFSTTLSDNISYAGKVITSILCKTHSRFQPQPGASYVARHSSRTSSDCKMEIFRLDANENRIPETSLEDLAWCIDPKIDDPAYLEKYPDKAP